MTLEQIIPWIAGLIGVPLVQFLKTTVGFDGKNAFTLTIGVSLLLATLSLWFSGGLTGAFVDPEHLLNAFGATLTTATAVYKYMFADQKD